MTIVGTGSGWMLVPEVASPNSPAAANLSGPMARGRIVARTAEGLGDPQISALTKRESEVSRGQHRPDGAERNQDEQSTHSHIHWNYRLRLAGTGE